MPNFKNKLPEFPESGMDRYSKEVQNSREYQDEIKRKEKESDRWFTAKMLIIGAAVGALLTKLFDFIFR